MSASDPRNVRAVAHAGVAILLTCTCVSCNFRVQPPPSRSGESTRRDVNPADSGSMHEFPDDAVSDLGKPQFSVTAVELSKAFWQDKRAAEKRFKEKVIEIEGIIIDRGNKVGTPSVMLKGWLSDKPDHPGEGQVLCSFNDREIRKINSLTIGQKVTVKGICDTLVWTAVAVKECQFVHVGDPVPGIVVKAAQLTREYAADEAAADKKYTKQELTIEGVVIGHGSDKDKGDSDLRTLILAGHDEKSAKPLRVRCHFGAVHAGQLKALRPGQQVRVRGNCLLGKSDNAVEIHMCMVLDKD